MFIRKNHFYIIIGVIVILMAAFIIYSINNDNTSIDDKDDAIKLVEEFGGTLKNVSLLAPRDVVIKSIKDNYSPYVTEELLHKWINNPRIAPGRISSSPWPDRIEITEIEGLSEGEFSIKGRIVEVTSTEIEGGGAAVFRPIDLILRKTGNKWLIDKIIIRNFEWLIY